MIYTIKKTSLLFLLFTGLLATGCGSFQTEEGLRKERKRALLKDPQFKELAKKTEKDLNKFFIALFGKGHHFDSEGMVNLELKMLINSSNGYKTMEIGSSFKEERKKHLKEIFKKAISEKSKYRIDWNTNDRDKKLATHVSTLCEIAKIIAKAHNDEHISDIDYQNAMKS